MKSFHELSCFKLFPFILAFAICLVPIAGIAQQGADRRRRPFPEQQVGNFSYSFGFSNLLINAEGREYVFAGKEGAEYGLADDRKISDLRWETRNAWLLGGEATINYQNRVRMNVGYWKRVQSGSGRHTDDDWMFLYDYGQLLQTHYSEGTSELDDGSQFDLNADVTLLYRMDNRLELKAVAGYKRQDWQWEEHDSYGIYFEPNETTQLLQDGDTIGAIGDGLIFQSSNVGITYQQEISLPYLGARLDYQLGDPVSLQTYAMYSKWVDIEATDHHLNRDLSTVDTLEDGEYWSLGANITWNFRPRWTFAGGVAFEEIGTMQGDSVWTFMVDEETGERLPTPLRETTEDEAGAGYAATIFSVNLSYQL